MKRLTGTHVYTYSKCPQAVALDLHEDRELRRPPTEVEEFVLRRGRVLEDQLTADLDWAEPTFPDRDFEAGAASTEALLREGVPGVLQGVLLEEDRLGIADLLRREVGESEFGDHHYVVGDIKSSRIGRGDQILQVMFYSRMLARLQGREPEYGYLVLRDGHEERYRYADYVAALDEVESRLLALRESRDGARPAFGYACQSCRWSEVCIPQLEALDDLSLLQGMTRGLRQMLEAGGITTCEAARGMPVELTARRTRLESTLLRRIKRAAEARHAGRPLREKRPAPAGDTEVAIVHMLRDAFAERVHYFGILYPATPDGEVFEALPPSPDAELPALLELVDRLPARTPLWHYGEAFPRWYEDAGWRRRESSELEAQFVDMARRLRGAAVYPGPVFGMHSHVAMALGVDPHRAGEAGGVGLWVGEADAASRLSEKGRSDLRDLAALKAAMIDGGEVEGDGPDT